VDESLSLSIETRCLEGVSPPAALSDGLCDIGEARGTDPRGKRISRLEGRSRPSKLLWLIRGAMADRLAGEERRRDGKAESLSELVS
jgi:hypothetical protein